MKKQKTLISLILALVMILTVPMAAWAEESFDQSIWVDNGSIYPPNPELPIADGTLEGDLTVEGNESALVVVASYDDDPGVTSTFTVEGSVEYTSPNEWERPAVESDAHGEKAESTANIGENVTAEGSPGIKAWAIDGGTAQVNVGGSIIAEDTGIIAIVADGGTAKTTVGGDVTATGEGSFGAGVSIYDDGENNSSVELTIKGTLGGEEAAVLLYGEARMSGDNPNVTLTVWKIEPNDDDALVVREQWDEQEEKFIHVQDKEAEVAIQYFIKVEEGSKQYVNPNKETARQGDTVTVKLNIPADQEIAEFTGGSATLTRDADGSYYLTVPRGGGVLLTLKLRSTAVYVPQPPTNNFPDLMTLCSVTDKSGNYTIDFYNNCTFKLFSSTTREELGKGEIGFNGKRVTLKDSSVEGSAAEPMGYDKGTNLFQFAFGGTSFEMDEQNAKLLVRCTMGAV